MMLNFIGENMNFDNCIKLSKIARVSGGKCLPKGFDYSKDHGFNIKTDQVLLADGTNDLRTKILAQVKNFYDLDG